MVINYRGQLLVVPLKKFKIMEIVVVKSFNSDVRAQIAAAVLRDNGIECAIAGENLINVMPLAGGQVTLSVNSIDQDRAEALLADY